MECAKLYLGCLVLACVYGTLSANCSAVPEDINVCFTSRGFPAPSRKQTSDGLPHFAAGLKGIFGADVCSKQSDFLEAVKCVVQLGQNCGSEVAAMLPYSLDQAEEMVSFECEQGAADMNCTYININTQDIITCIQDEARIVVDISGPSDLTHIFCGTLEASSDCIIPAVKKCGCAAVKYIAKYLTGSLRPTFCGASTHDVDLGSCGGGAAIVAHPVMLLLGLFAIMINF